MSPDRYPLQPLLDILAGRGVDTDTLRPVADALGVSHETVRSILAAGHLTEIQADTYACRLSLLPCLVWLEWDRPIPQCQRCVDDYDCPTHCRGCTKTRLCDDHAPARVDTRKAS